MSRADRRARRAAKRRRRGSFLIGAITGALVGLLVAPKTGKEMRARLFGEGGVGSQIDRLKGAVGAGRESAADQSEALRRKIEETRERLRRQMDADDAEASGDDAPAG